MKLLCLNAWGGEKQQPLLQLIQSLNDDIDIFCFQEVFNGNGNERTINLIKNAPHGIANIYSQIKHILSDYDGYFAPSENILGLAIFIKKNIAVEKHGDFFIYKSKNAMTNNDPATQGKNLQYIQFSCNGRQFTVCNLHGIFDWQGKVDTQSRLEQSQKILSFFQTLPGEKILVGDFNLTPDTQSINLLEKSLNNLIKDFKIKLTRSNFYDRLKLGDTFADYVFVSKGVVVNNFKVLPDEVSDHLPLFLDFN
jgi:endonuclease/exonuclease/phosphatase family metal-dependent hydrolase